MAQTIEFLLNGEHIRTDESPGLLVLDWLRLRRRLTGTKEGCKEGDCGACTVLLGTLDEGAVRYKPVTSCLVPLGELHGRHLVTIEGVSPPPGRLSPVQQAMVDEGGSQCGFCTPGFVVSMSWYLMQGEGEAPSLEGFKRAISGNLCRCTGYGAINRASEALVRRFGPGGAHEGLWASPDRVEALAGEGLLPSHFKGVAERLAMIPDYEGEDGQAEFFVAGGTDLYVQRGELIPEARVSVLKHRRALEYLRHEDGAVRLGPLTTFEDFGNDPGIQAMMPTIGEAMELIASLHIRNRATVAGNIVNASPIGDMTILMMALGARLVLTREGDGHRREVALEDFYKGYKLLDKTADELITEISFPTWGQGVGVNFEKVSKRRALDIASVNSAARIGVDGRGVVTEARLAVGGVAPVPLFLRKTSAWLVGRVMSPHTALEAVVVAQGELSPISDVRGSADYKRLLARQLLLAHFTRLFPTRVTTGDVLGGGDAGRREVMS